MATSSLSLSRFREAIANPLILNLKLCRGRKLAYGDFGAKNGIPIIHFHGAMSSHLEGYCSGPVAEEHGFRILAIDRPGHGMSTFDPFHTYESLCDDVLQLLSHVHNVPKLTKDMKQNLEFGVSGASQGAVFAQAVTYHLATKHGMYPSFMNLLCGLPMPFKEVKTPNTVDIKVPKMISDWLPRSAMDLYLESMLKHPGIRDVEDNKLWGRMCEEDKRVLKKPMFPKEAEEEEEEEEGEFRAFDFLMENMDYSVKESRVKGIGQSAEMTLSSKELGFGVKEFAHVMRKVEHVNVFHGMQDTLVAFEWVQRYIETLKRYRLKWNFEFEKNAGHMFLFEEKENEKVFQITRKLLTKKKDFLE